MATAAEVIENALRKIGVIASSEDPSSAEQADGFVSLKQLIESLSNDSMLIFSDNEESFTLVSSQSSYTFYTGGDFNSARPIKITKARVQVTSGGDTYEVPVKILTRDEWNDIIQKDNTSDIPEAIYVDYGATYATVYVYPVPTAANTLILNSEKIIQSLSAVSDTIAMPQGFLRMLEYNLAVEVAPEFGVEASPTVQRIARDSLAALKRKYKRTPLMSTDIERFSHSQDFDLLKGYV